MAELTCTIGGYHSWGQLQRLSTCDLCGAIVCSDHKGYHWERVHREEAK